MNNQDLIISFNAAFSYFPYSGDYIKTVQIPFLPPHIRMGGTCMKDYKFNADYDYFKPDVTARDKFYSRYKGWNKRNTYAWQFINIITANLTRPASTQFVLPLMNHYIGSVRAELITNYAKLDSINTYEGLQASTFSPAFKETVKDIFDLYYAFVNNGVSIEFIELCSETYADDGQGVLDYMKPYDRLLWSRTNNTELSLRVFGTLCALYVRMFKNVNPLLKFGMPMPEEVTGGFVKWAAFFLDPGVMKIINYDFVVFHPYAKPVNSTEALSSYWAILTQRENYYSYLKSVVVPLLNGRGIGLSEFSSSEYNPVLRGTDFDRLLYLNEIRLMKTIPNIVSCHLHAFSNNASTNVAVKMNGSSKQQDIKLMPIGVGYMSLQK